MRLLALAALVTLLAGCTPRTLVHDAPTGGLPTGYPDHSAAQIRTLVEASVGGVTAYRSETRISATTAERDLDASAGLRARLADTLFVVVRGPLGIEGGRALVTRDSLFAHDRINGRLYLGPLAAAERYVPGGGRPGRLARALLGLEAPPVEAGWTVRAQSGRYVLTAPDGAQTWVVDPRLWRAVAVEERAADGRRLTRSYEQFDTVDGVAVPRRVVLASPDDAATLSVEHRSVTLNPPDLAFPFAPPSDAEVVRLR